MRKILFPLAVAIVAGAIGLICGIKLAEKEPEPPRKTEELGLPDIEALYSGDADARKKYVKDMHNTYAIVTSELLKVARTTPTKEQAAADSPRDCAIYILGLWRAEEAVGWLVRNVDHTYDDHIVRNTSTHPCVGALYHMGWPALRRILRLAVEPHNPVLEDEEKKKLLAKVFVYMLGNKRRAFALIDADMTVTKEGRRLEYLKELRGYVE